MPVAHDDVQRSLAWQKHEIDFSTAPLSDMVTEFNRYNEHKLVIADERLASKHFGGSFRSDDYAGFVRMLKQNFNVDSREENGTTVLNLAP
jgi:transmembrane sensor